MLWLRGSKSDSELQRFKTLLRFLGWTSFPKQKPLVLGKSRFFSQPFFVAEQFTGTPGVFTELKDTIRGFREILDGKHDDIPEKAFLYAGTIDEVVEKAKKLM